MAITLTQAIKRTDTDILEVHGTQPAVNPDGTPLMVPQLDDSGNPVLVPVLDEQGQPVIDTTPVLDSDRQPVLDADGTPQTISTPRMAVQLVQRIDEVTANGWVSATTNHFDASAYHTDEHGNLQRDPDAQPRDMTSDEVRAYCQSLLDATQPPVAPIPEPTEVITF